jgi:hypothetical protein
LNFLAQSEVDDDVGFVGTGAKANTLVDIAVETKKAAAAALDTIFILAAIVFVWIVLL